MAGAGRDDHTVQDSLIYNHIHVSYNQDITKSNQFGHSNLTANDKSS